MSESKLPSWPPYLVAFLSFVGINVIAAIVVGGYLFATAGDPSLPMDARVEQLAKLSSTPQALVLSVVLTSTLFIVIGAWASARGGRRSGAAVVRRMRLYPVDARDAFAASVGVLGTSMVLDVFVEVLGLGGQGSLGSIHDALNVLPGHLLFAAALVVGVFPGIGEEVFFRGFLMRRIEAADGWKTAWVASSILFGIFHFDPIHSPTAGLIGLYLGWMVLRSGSLWVGVVAHTLNNFVATVTVGRPIPDALAPLVAFVGLAAAGSAVWYVKERRPTVVVGDW